MRSPTPSRALVIALAIALTSCAPPPPGFSSCLTDRDCTAGQRCVGGGCVAPGLDASAVDAGLADAAATDAAAVDGEGSDAAAPDAAAPDAAAADAARVAIPGDDCASALGIPLVAMGAGVLVGIVTGDTSAMYDDYRTACHSPAPSGGDAVYFFDVPSPSDVMVEIADPDFDSVISVSYGCGTSELNGGCNDDYDPPVSGGSRVFLHPAFAMVRYYVLVDGNDGSSGPFTLRVVLRTAAAANTCAAPMDISGGGTVLGQIEAPGAEISGMCQTAGEVTDAHAVLGFDVPADGATTELTASSTAFFPDLYVRESTCASGPERSCVHGGAATTTATDITFGAGVPRGYVFVDGARAGDDYRLDYDP